MSDRMKWVKVGLLRAIFACAALFVAFPSSAQTYHLGNDAPLGDVGLNYANYLLGSKINVPSEALLTGVGIIFASAGYNAQVAIYTDNAGEPGTLVAKTSLFPAAVGALEEPVPLTLLPAGDYWFMAVYDDDASVSYTSATTVTYKFRSLSTGNPIPDPFGSVSSYCCAEFAYYLVLEPPEAYHLGNDTPLGDASLNYSDFLLGSKINVPSEARLIGVGIIFASAGYNGQVAIYADDAGQPGSLVAQTSSFPAAVGALEEPVPPTLLPAGDYWFMAVYDDDASISYDSASTATVKYRGLIFGNPIPDPFGIAGTYSGQEFAYYLVVPEPSHAAMLLSGIAGLAGLGSLRRRKLTRTDGDLDAGAKAL